MGSQGETNTNSESSSERLVAIHMETLCTPPGFLLDCASQDTGTNTTSRAGTARGIFAGYKYPPPESQNEDSPSQGHLGHTPTYI